MGGSVPTGIPFVLGQSHSRVRHLWNVAPRAHCMERQPSNQAVERTATRYVFTFSVTRAVTLPAMRALGGRRSLYSR